MVSDGDTAGVLQCWKEFISVATDGVTARVVKYVKKVTPLYQMVVKRLCNNITKIKWKVLVIGQTVSEW